MPPKPKRELRNLKVREVSLVDDGDNPGARVLLFKRKLDDEDVKPKKPRKRPRRGRGKVDGENEVAKLTVDTSSEDGHVHALELPDGAIAQGQFRTNEANGHTHDLDLPDLQPGQKADVQTSEVEGHAHSVAVEAVERVRAQKQEQDFRTEGGTRYKRNAYALNTGSPSGWRLRLYDTQADADAKRPSVRLTAAAAQALGPSGFRGQRVQLPNGTRPAVVGRVRAAWMRARRQAGQEVSRDDLPTVLKKEGTMKLIDKIMDHVRSWSGKEPDEDLQKRLFDEIRAESLDEQVADAVLNRVHDLARSVREAMFMRDEEDQTDPQVAISESLAQFATTMDKDLADIFAGRIVKAVEDIDDVEEKPDEEEVTKILRDLFTVEPSQADDAGATKEEGMDLSKLSKEDRDKVEAALDAAGSVEKFALNFKDLAALVTSAAADKDELTKLKGDPDPDPLKDLPDEVRKIVDDRVTKLSEENVTLKERLDKVETDRKREEFEKSVGDLAGLPQKRDDIVKALWTITDEDQRAVVQKNLEAAAEAARRGNLFSEIGSGLSEGGSAYSKIVAKAEELRKANPSLTEAAARAQAMNENPELYDEYLVESSPPIN